jgi:hypothetical protein
VYSARTADGGRRTFGTSGLLYRSNKLMYDRQSYTLWSNLTGEPVVGRLAHSPVRLEMLPMSLTTWGEWRQTHPGTTVMKLDRRHGEPWNFRYVPGAADRARSGVSFPVWPKSSALEREAEVYAIRPGGRPKAYPISLVLEKGVINDSVGDLQLVVVGHPESGTVRVYERRGLTFRPGPSPDLLRDESDRTWRLTEAALVVDSSAGDLMSLARVPGHVSFWFAWYGFFPHTELYPPPGGHATEPQ